MSLILEATAGPKDWRKHLAQPTLHWKPGRSAMETALCWEEAGGGLPPAIAAVVQPDTRMIQAIVEYPVALPGGGTDSKSDVFALLSDAQGLIACVVEAKRDEPFGPTLGEWRADGRNLSGKVARLDALRDLLGLDRVPDTIRYQLLHRTASAILAARRYHTTRAMMVVQSFSPERRWFDDYGAFLALLGLDARDGAPVMARFSGVDVTFAWVTSPLSGHDLREGA
ncbi:DUF6946 family protein [Jannaschia sp. M317]|uniref:DUF6946 family protein n=1 Tax=Jannaschia sp. M317 TaxID=2867011 RepID=UPI0021A8232E|nr:hypothetical protein [Jannaschia sp. M317]UWQ16942.1 hypothetical protein K3551_13720 [Jannaschia sp. M317]